MTNEEFRQQMFNLNAAFGGFPPSVYDYWFEQFQKFNEIEFRNAVNRAATEMTTKPKIADLLNYLSKNTVAGGSQDVVSNGCDSCGGSGFAQVEVRRGTISCMRCICDRGEGISGRIARLTKDMILERRVNILGQIVFKNDAEELREYKISEMTTPKTIEWARRGLGKSCIRSF